MKIYRTAQVRFNRGRGALLCSSCGKIISQGHNHIDVAHICKQCSGLLKLLIVTTDNMLWLEVYPETPEKALEYCEAFNDFENQVWMNYRGVWYIYRNDKYQGTMHGEQWEKTGTDPFYDLESLFTHRGKGIPGAHP